MEYKIAKYLSSFEFYKEMSELNEYIDLYKPSKIVLDFSDIVRIEAVVIPNLLLWGRHIREKTGYIPYIRLGEKLGSGYLKKYLLGINFYGLSDKFFNYENDIYSGVEGKDMDPRNTTAYFLRSDGIQVARRRIYYQLYPFISNYLKMFASNKFNCMTLSGHVFENNIVAKFIEEIIENSFEYGKSDVIVTVQANYKKERLYLSISDFGNGFYASTQEVDSSGDQDAYNVLGRKPRNEMEGILFGIYKRKNSKIYGLYNVVRRVLMLRGIIRIHSNCEQLILTSNLLEKFDDESLLSFMHKTRYNIVKTGIFPGAHIEIEIPFN